MTAQPATPREVIGYAMCDFRAAGEEDCPEQPGGICEFCYDRADRLMKQLRIAGPDEAVLPDADHFTLEMENAVLRMLVELKIPWPEGAPLFIGQALYRAMISAAEKASGDGK